MNPRPVDLPEHEIFAQIQMARNGNLTGAIEHIERALRTALDRESIATAAATGLAEIARLAEQADALAIAVRAVEGALAVRPHFADLHFHRARLLIASHRRAEAREALESALRINPRYVAARVELALLDARDGLVGDALQALSSIKDDTRLDDAGAFQQGMRSLERADWDEADSLLKRALNLSDPALKSKLAEVHENLEAGEADRAAQSLRKILERTPAYPDLHDLLGMAELRLGHYDDALNSFARALELQPDFHAARVHLAQALEGLGQVNEAKAQLGMALEADPGNVQARKLADRWAERSASGALDMGYQDAPDRFPRRSDEVA